MKWKTQYPVNYTEGGDRTNQAIEKHMNELAYVYSLLNELRGIRPSAGAPADVEDGDIWFDTSLGRLMRRAGGNNVPAVKQASDADARAGSDDSLMMTPKTVKTAIEYGMDQRYATADLSGVVKLATADDGRANATKAVSPVVAASIAAAVSAETVAASNAKSATALSPGSKINGTAFTGAADVTVNLANLYQDSSGRYPVGKVISVRGSASAGSAPSYIPPVDQNYGVWVLIAAPISSENRTERVYYWREAIYQRVG